MELFLLLWFYDNRWFFNLKISILCFKNSWIIPLFLHAFLMTICIYYLCLHSSVDCEANLRAWLIGHSFFSFLLVLNIVLFMKKITEIYDKERSFLEHTKKIYPVMRGEQNKLDLWVRRESIRSCNGKTLMILGLISLSWSLLLLGFYRSKQVYKNCDIIIRKMLDMHSMFIFFGNMPIIILFLSFLTVKTFSFVSTYLCPDLQIWMSEPWKNEEIEAEKS